MQRPPQIFDENRILNIRRRAGKNFAEHRFLHDRVEEDIIDRLETVTRDFPDAVIEGSSTLPSRLTDRCGVGDVLALDSVTTRLASGKMQALALPSLPPLGPQSVDLYVSVLTLHTVNDLVGSLAQIRFALKPDGLLICAMLGGDTLSNLRQSFYRAESELLGGVTARIAPFASVQDLGQALTRAGFSLPVVDVDKVRVEYKEPIRLLHDLRGMGLSSPLTNPSRALRRDVLERALEIFSENYSAETFEVAYLTGWAPHESQQKPLKPGSARHSLAEAVLTQSEDKK